MKRVKREIGKKLPDFAVYCGAGSKYENPFEKNVQMDEDEKMFRYRRYLADGVKTKKIDLRPLAGSDLACYCDLDKPCHVDEILKYFAEENER